MSRDKATTVPGFVNPHGQEVIRNTGKAGTDHGQYVYELNCQHCGRHYGANGSDIQIVPSAKVAAPALRSDRIDKAETIGPRS